MFSKKSAPTKTVTYPTKVTNAKGHTIRRCSTCGGSGKTAFAVNRKTKVKPPCHSCGGTGYAH